MTLRTLRNQAIDVQHLAPEKRIKKKGLNQHSQQALGLIILPLKLASLQSEAKFYIINADTFYKALLGKTRLHYYYVVPSTIHQCMKYM